MAKVELKQPVVAEIAELLDISRITVWRRRTRAQVKYKTLFF